MKTQEERASSSMDLGADLSGSTATASQPGVTRRAFVGGMGAMMAAAAAAVAGSKSAFADEAEEAEEEEATEEEESTEGEDFSEENMENFLTATDTEEEEEHVTYANYPTIESVTGWTGTPEDVLALGVSTMPLEDLNQYRQAYVDAQTDYTCEDGTVVPAAYVKMRALINSYGMGAGGTPVDDSFTTLMELYTEEEAEFYIKMPMGVNFTAYECAEEEGVELEEAEEMCELFASNGFLCSFDSNRGHLYHEVPYFQGTAEYGHMRSEEKYRLYWPDYSGDTGIRGSDFDYDMANVGTPTFYTVPVDASVSSDGTIYAVDDVKEKLRNVSVASITPCPCRYSALIAAYGLDAIPSMDDFHTGEYEDYFSDLVDQRVETCIQTGDEALYWIELGMGRQITGEQAAEYLQRSVDDGFMLNSTFGKNGDTICSCNVSSCILLASWASIGDAEDIAECNAFKQVSHYTLEVDSDKCIACGTCVDRCPMGIITINDDGWAEPGVNCFRCGQCCYVCPQDARHLVKRDESELAPMPQDMLEDSNAKAAYRFEMGLIPFPEASDDAEEDEEAAAAEESDAEAEAEETETAAEDAEVAEEEAAEEEAAEDAEAEGAEETAAEDAEAEEEVA